MENIDCIYYINLYHREDRMQMFLQEMKRIDVPLEKIIRVEATYISGFGILGCGLSHKKTLEMFMKSSHKNCLVFEDDFMWTQDINYTKYILRSIFDEKVPFDLVMLSGNIFADSSSQWPALKRVTDGQTTSAYLITREFAPKLIQNLEESTTLLEDWHKKFNEKKHEYCLDIYWKKLQTDNRWYITYPKLGIQRESYSDIENSVTSYGV